MLLIPILLPIALGAIIPLLHFKKRNQREIYVLAVVTVNTLITYFLIFQMPAGESFTLLHLTENLAVTFRMDGLAKVFAGLVAGLWPFATLYAFEYMRHEGRENYFFTFYTMTFGITMGIACAANVMTMYLFYELLTLITVPLVMHYMDHKSVRAGIKYLKYSIGGAAFAFIGFILLNYYAGGNDFSYGGILTGQGITHENTPILLTAYVMMFFGFGVKAAVFPFHGWLPSASVAPTPVTALLHAVAVVKSGVFAIMRVTFFSFGPAFLAGTWAQYVPMTFAIITIVFGSAMAVREQHIKRRLAYSTISNLSYIVFGATLMTPIGFVAAMAHMVFHGIMKIALFFCAGAIMHQTGSEYIYEIEGYGKKMKKTFAVFLVASLSLIGVPPLAGFFSKWKLLEAGVLSGETLGIVGVAGLLISALLTAIYLFTILLRAYFPDMIHTEAGNSVVQNAQAEAAAASDKAAGHGHPHKVADPNWYMILPLFVFTVAIIVFGVFPGPLVDFFMKIAEGALTIMPGAFM